MINEGLTQLIESNNLALKQLEETDVSMKLLVHSRRTAYLYGKQNEVYEILPIEQFLLKILREKGSITRDQLVRLTNMPRTTLYDALTKLILEGVVTKRVARTRKRGRPKILFRLTLLGLIETELF